VLLLLLLLLQVMNYFHVAEHMRGIWMANVSNYLLSFTYAKVRALAEPAVRGRACHANVDQCTTVTSTQCCRPDYSAWCFPRLPSRSRHMPFKSNHQMPKPTSPLAAIAVPLHLQIFLTIVTNGSLIRRCCFLRF
jgi:hypothetical protein